MLRRAGDGGLEEVELAGGLDAAAAGESGQVRVFCRRLRANPQFAGDLIGAQAALLRQKAALAIGLAIDQFGTSIVARKISPKESGSDSLAPSSSGSGGPCWIIRFNKLMNMVNTIA